MARSITSLQDMRSVFAQFCSDRDWQKFHLPMNLLLALSGECGEVSEIYQWKGSLEGEDLKTLVSSNFSEKETTHIGEEIADVFIYSVRLADVCNIDLAHAVRLNLGIKCEKHDSFGIESAAESWEDISFEHLGNVAEMYVNGANVGPKSQRHVVLSLLHSLGRVTAVFQNHSEADSGVGLPLWPASDLQAAASGLGAIIVSLSRLAAFSSLQLAHCITDKLAKNEAKYPVSLAKGKSDKYTAYADKLALRKPEEKGKASGSNEGKNVSFADKEDENAPKLTNKQIRETIARMEAIEGKLPIMVILVILAALALGYAVGKYN